MDTPPDFKTTLRLRCQAAPKRLALPDSDDLRILMVAQQLLAEGSARSISLFIPRTEVEALARANSVALPLGTDRLLFPVDTLLTPAERLKLAGAQLKQGQVDAVLGGNVATTADVIRAGIKQVGLAPGVRTVSGAFIMHRTAPQDPSAAASTYLFADCGVVIAPTLEQLVDIATASVATWRHLQPDEPPVVAFLSFSSKGSAEHPAAKIMAEAARRYKASSPAVDCDGELQFDAAFSTAIGARKAPGSKVPGRANCFIFPDLNAGNIGYKIAQRLGGFEAYGPILQGLAKPMNDLSRGATVEDIVASAYITLSRAV